LGFGLGGDLRDMPTNAAESCHFAPSEAAEAGNYFPN
jgi:hypothetical protein